MNIKFFMVYPYLKLHILFYSNGLNLSGPVFQILYIIITKIMADNVGHNNIVSIQILPNLELIWAISEMEKYGINFGVIHKKC